MSPPAKISTDVGDSLGPTVGVSCSVKIVAVLLCFILALFFVTLYLYAKHVRDLDLDRTLRRRRSRLIFAASDPVTFHRRGLDAAILRSLPITMFKGDPEEELECAVCLCELSDGEEVRMLPKCNHGFHLECIDMWFHSHSTCPLCRSPVGLPVPVSVPVITAESTVATNKLFSGTPNAEPSSSVSASLVIDIPRRVMMQGFSSSPSTPLPTSDDYENQMTSTKTTTPTSARLRSLTRLLSRGKRTMGATSTVSPGVIEDIEQGQGLLVGAVGDSRQGVSDLSVRM